MIEPGGTAPYAPTPAVTGFIDAFRNRPLPTPIDADVLARIPVADSIIPRTLQTLKLLDLLDGSGNPTAALQDLRKAGSEEFPARLAEVVRAAYADVFTYRDPATDDVSKIEDAFRNYEPMSMRPRMVRLFLGLCKEAGIIEDAAPVANVPSRPGRVIIKSGGGTRSRSGRTQPSQPDVHKEAIGPRRTADEVPGADHLAIRGLLMTLPPVGAYFPDEKRKEWADAMIAAFALIYEREEPKRKGGESG